MPATQTKPRPTPADRAHEEKMSRLKLQHGAQKQQQTKLDIQKTAADGAEAVKDRAHEVKMAQHEKDMIELETKAALKTDLEAIQADGLNRLKTTPIEFLRGKVTTAIQGHAKKIHDKARDALFDSDKKKIQATVLNGQRDVGLSGRLKKAKSFVKTDKTGAVDEPDTTLNARDAMKRMSELRLRSPKVNIRSSQNKDDDRKDSSKKKELINNSLNEAVSITNSPLSGHMWFTGTYVPFSAHHAEAIRTNFNLYKTIPNLKPQLFIGITGKEKPDDFEHPNISPTVRDADGYVAQVRTKFNSYLKTNIPISYKMKVARAAAPDLADSMVWVKNALGTPPTPYHKGPQPGSIIHSDTLADSVLKMPKGYSKGTRYGMTQHEESGTYIQRPNMIKDAKGNKVSTTPMRMALLDNHVAQLRETNPIRRRILEQHGDELHAATLGVPTDHPAVQANKEMFDWAAHGWVNIEKDAREEYARKWMRNEDVVIEDRRHSAGVGERLLRGQSLQSTGKRIGSRQPPPTNEKLLMRRARRAAHYEIRKKIAPNYAKLSTGQKQEIDDRIARYPQLKTLVDSNYKEYRKKAAEHMHSSTRVKHVKNR